MDVLHSPRQLVENAVGSVGRRSTDNEQTHTNGPSRSGVGGMRREVHEASTTDTLTLDLTRLLIVRGLLTQLTRGDFLQHDAASVL